MKNLGLLATLKAKKGKEMEVSNFIKEAENWQGKRRKQLLGIRLK